MHPTPPHCQCSRAHPTPSLTCLVPPQLCGLLETLRGATRATLTATQPAMQALFGPLLQPLLVLQVGAPTPCPL